jgi:hypothetical protein
MRQSGFRAWKVFGGLVAAALLSVGCGRLPDSGGQHPDSPPEDFFGGRVDRLSPEVYERAHVSADRGYNGTIQQLGSSIDPRTQQNLGQQGNSRQVDVTGRPAPRAPELGIGGSGYVGKPARSSEMGWRARRGYDVGPAPDSGSFVGSPAQ